MHTAFTGHSAHLRRGYVSTEKRAFCIVQLSRHLLLSGAAFLAFVRAKMRLLSAATVARVSSFVRAQTPCEQPVSCNRGNMTTQAWLFHISKTQHYHFFESLVGASTIIIYAVVCYIVPPFSPVNEHDHWPRIRRSCQKHSEKIHSFAWTKQTKNGKKHTKKGGGTC